MIISSISAKSIFDSRKEKTIQVSVNNEKASSPSGKSKGKYETPSYKPTLRDDIKKINKLKSLIGLEINSFQDLTKIESKLKNKIGANSLYALESAILKALAKSQNKELYQIVNKNLKNKKIKIPIPLGNSVGGGLHSLNKQKSVFQEFLIIPSSSSIKDNVKIMNSVYSDLKEKIKSQGKNDEGAWQTSFSEEDILSILSKYKEIKIGIDIAASTFYKNGNYLYKNRKLSRLGQIDYINKLIRYFSIYYIEDPLEEKDFAGFSRIKRLGIFNKTLKTLVCGDDLTVTHLSRLKKALKSKSINSMIIKPNQNGSLLELAKIFKFCRKHKIKTILSHRSGETLDSALADYAVGFQADFIKTGISGKEREVKLSRLIEIEKSLKN